MSDLPTQQGASAASRNILTALLEARTGQRMGHDRAWRLDTALQPLLRTHHLTTLDQLVQLLLRGNEAGLSDHIVDALLNNETSFFRDAGVIEMVVDAVAAAAAAGRRLRIWSAGCSTGQEPLSLAMALSERCESGAMAMPEIVATDVSDAAIARAREGRFTQFEIQRGLPMRRMLRWFEVQPDGDWLADPALLRQISFRRLNLVEPWAIGKFDVILCRNVLLYLVPAIKTAAFERFADTLRGDGLMVLGAGETVLGQTALFEPSRTVRGAYQHARAARAVA